MAGRLSTKLLVYKRKGLQNHTTQLSAKRSENRASKPRRALGSLAVYIQESFSIHISKSASLREESFDNMMDYACVLAR